MPTSAGPHHLLVDFTAAEDRPPYVKADFVQVSRIDNNYAVTFYQLDYQDIIDQIKNTESRQPGQPEPELKGKVVAVSKIVLDEAGFKRLFDEINRISSEVEKAEKTAQ